MKWITANRLSSWAKERRDAASTKFSDLMQQLVRASVSDATAFRFPAGENAQMHGWDGRLIAHVTGLYGAYVPDGESVWEWGVEGTYRRKADSDWDTRKANPGVGIDPAENTFVFATPHKWEKKDDWIADKIAGGSPWKDIRILDGESIEEWAELCSAAAATFARQNGFMPTQGVESMEEFWENYSARFEPKLSEAAVLAGRTAQREALLDALARNGPIRCKGDSLDEVTAFVAATIRSADTDTRSFWNARVLLVRSPEAARELGTQPHLAFVVADTATSAAGGLSYEHSVVVPIGRDLGQFDQTISLVRPTFHELTEALRTMGLPEDRAVRLPHECGRSVSILARRIPRTDAPRPKWSGDASLIPALLAGAWDRSSQGDREMVRQLVGMETYDHAEATLRPYLRIDEAPLETAGEVWAVKAPVDLYVNIDHLLGMEHWAHFAELAKVVFAEIDPAQEMPPEERIYANLRGKGLSHSQWLRDGMATTLLIFAALSPAEMRLRDGRTAQAFVNDVVGSIPGLSSDWRVIASLSKQLPMLMEAAPHPLLSALEQLLKGDGEGMLPIFQDSKDQSPLFHSSPHTGLLWALEIAGEDPSLLARTVNVLARLAEIDPQGRLANRPSATLKELFRSWNPKTNAPLDFRLAVLDQLVLDHPEEGWKLLLDLIPHNHEHSFSSTRPKFRDSGLSEREKITWDVLHRTVAEIVLRLITLAGTKAARWKSLLDQLGVLDPRDRRILIGGFELAASHMSPAEREEIWQPLAALIRRHKTHPEFDWTMAEQEMRPLESVLTRIAPQNEAIRNRYLFQERLPEIPGVDIHGRWEKAEELRLDTIRQILKVEGIKGVIRFATEVESPRFVGGAFGQIAPNVEIILQTVKASFDQHIDFKFIIALSGAAFFVFRNEWMNCVEDAIKTGMLKEDQVALLLDGWPNEPLVWRWLGEVTIDSLKVFWSRHSAWGIKTSDEDLRFAITKYLEADRPDFVVDALGMQSAAIPTDLLVKTLEAFESSATAESALLDSGAAYNLKLMFEELQKRDDVQLELVAALEYRFLPVLRDLFSSTDPNSALDRFLSENPDFFVTVVSNVFIAQSDRDKPRPEPTKQEQARGEHSFRLLESFSRIPGREGATIAFEQLDGWVSEARRRGIEADRAVMTEQYIGKLLVHAPSDPDDQVWPHAAVRKGLEKWRSSDIELGIHVGKINAHGPTTRGSYEGGDQERAVAAAYRADAARLQAWPRTRAVILSLAESYERSAAMMDTRVAQLRLKE